MKVWLSLNATRYLQICRMIHKHLVETTTAIWLQSLLDGNSGNSRDDNGLGIGHIHKSRRNHAVAANGHAELVPRGHAHYHNIANILR